jgi:excisionase family DNA binding protein
MRSDVRSALQPYEALVASPRYDVEAQPRLRHISPQQARGAAMSRSNSPRPQRDQRDQGQLLDVPAVARRLDVSEKTVRRLIARGELRAHRIGRLLRISEEELRRLIDASW